MSDVRNLRDLLLRGTVTSLLAITSVSAIGLLDSMVVARIIGQAKFGLLALAVSVMNVALGVASLGLPGAIAKFLSGETARSRDAAQRTLISGIRLALTSSLIVGVASGTVGVLWLAPFYNEPALVPIFVLMAICVIAGAPVLLFASALQGFGQVRDLNIRSVLAAVVTLLFSVVLSSYFSTPGAFLAFTASLLLPGILSARKAFSTLRERPSVALARPVPIAALLNYGLPSLLASLAVLPVLYYVNALVAMTGGLTGLGLFAVAYFIAGALSLLPLAVSVPLMPVLSSLSVSDPTHGKVIVPRVVRLVSFVSVPAAILMMTFGPELISITYGGEYSPGSPILSALSVAMVLLAVSGIVGRQLAGAGRMWWSLAINVAWAAVVAISASWLIPRWAGIGAAAAILIGYSITGFLSWLVGTSILKIDFREARLSSAWTAVLLSLTLGTVLLFLEARVAGGTAIFGAAAASGALLLNAQEKSIAREVLAAVGIQRRPSVSKKV